MKRVASPFPIKTLGNDMRLLKEPSLKLWKFFLLAIQLIVGQLSLEQTPYNWCKYWPMEAFFDTYIFLGHSSPVQKQPLATTNCSKTKALVPEMRQKVNFLTCYPNAFSSAVSFVGNSQRSQQSLVVCFLTGRISVNRSFIILKPLRIMWLTMLTVCFPRTVVYLIKHCPVDTTHLLG